MATAPAFASIGEALEMVRAGLGYLAAADAAQLGAATQAQVLRELEQTDAAATAARASFLAAFTAGAGPARENPRREPVRRVPRRNAAGYHVTFVAASIHTNLISTRRTYFGNRRGFPGNVVARWLNRIQILEACPFPGTTRTARSGD